MPRTKQLITPKPLPTAARRPRAGEYAVALEQFLAADCASAVVNIGKKPATVAQGLAKAIRSDARFAKLKVARRADDVYIVKG